LIYIFHQIAEGLPARVMGRNLVETTGLTRKPNLSEASLNAPKNTRRIDIHDFEDRLRRAEDRIW